MALPIYFYILLFISTSSSVGYAHTILERYVPLISDVHISYGTSSIFFVLSNINQNMQKYVLLHTLSREFSRKDVLSLVINSKMLKERIKMWQNRVSRALGVVMLTTPDEVTDFIINTRETDISNHIWLLIFLDECGEKMCEYCKKEMKNIFHLRFDTEMLVVCCQDPVIKEWWALKENKTGDADLAKWTEKEGLTFLKTNVLYQRRHDINGTGLRVTFVKNSMVSIHLGRYQFGQFLYHFFKELQQAMNFEVTSVIEKKRAGTWNCTTKRWSGVISQVVEGNADIGIGLFIVTHHRLDAVDFSFPLLSAESQLFIKEPYGLEVGWFSYFKAFHREVWMAFFILVIATPILLTVIKMKSRLDSLPCLLSENYIHVWGIFCQQALDQFPAETSLRIAYFSIFVSAWVVLSAYSASFISFLTVSTVSLPFSTVQGFVQDGSYKLIVLKNSADDELFTESTDADLVRMNQLMKPRSQLPQTMMEGFHQVCREKVALYTTGAWVQSMDIRMPCRIIRINTERVVSMGLILSHKSQYTGVVNYHIQRFRDNGILNRLKKTYLKNLDPAPDTSHAVVTILGVAPILSILAGGMILAFVVLFCEKIFRSFTNWAGKRQRARLRRIKMHKWFDSLEKLRMPQQNLQSCLEFRIRRLNNSPPRYQS